MLRAMEVPRNEIDACIDDVRTEAQPSDRPASVRESRVRDVHPLGAMRIESARVFPESPVAGASPIALRFRSETGALVVGTRRGDELLDEPDPSLPFEPGDIVYFVGTRDALERALRLFDPRSRCDEDDEDA